MMPMMGWGMMIAMMIFAILILIFLVYAVGSLITKSGNKDDSALQILKERFVRGEINEEEYKRKSEFLKK